MMDIALKAANLGQEISRLADQRAAAMSSFKGQIESRETDLDSVFATIKSGLQNAEVPCTWTFEVSGVDDEGTPVYDPDGKTLFRDDTGEVVEVARITGDDRQLLLGMDNGDETPSNVVPIEQDENDDTAITDAKQALDDAENAMQS
jgi:hypothetical protein